MMNIDSRDIIDRNAINKQEKEEEEIT